MSAECIHTLESGHKCHAPARNGSTFCHHHAPRPQLDPNPREMQQSEPIALPPLHSKCSMLLAVNEVLDALAGRRIKSSEARALLFGLKFAHHLMTEIEQEARHTHFESEAFEEFQEQAAVRQPAEPPQAAPSRKPGHEELEELLHNLQQAAHQQLRNQDPATTRKKPVISDHDRALAAIAASADNWTE